MVSDTLSAIALPPVHPHVFKGEEAVKTELRQAGQHTVKIDRVLVDGGLQSFRSPSTHVNVRSERQQIVHSRRTLTGHNMLMSPRNRKISLFILSNLFMRSLCSKIKD